MDQVLNKVGSYWFSKRASKEIDSIGSDISVSPARLPPFAVLAAPVVLHPHCVVPTSRNGDSGSGAVVVGDYSFFALRRLRMVDFGLDRKGGLRKRS
jgi:hypothetical protein